MMKKHGWWIVTLALIGAFIAFLVVQANRPGKYDQFAQCIADSGTKFYGAWWCPHCQSQKALFGRSSKLLPYIECQSKSRDTYQVCIDAAVEKFPTWTFVDGTRELGELTFDELNTKTGCQLSEAEKAD